MDKEQEMMERMDYEMEIRMRKDFDYALEVLEQKYNIEESFERLKDFKRELSDLGYELSIKEIVDIYA